MKFKNKKAKPPKHFTLANHQLIVNIYLNLEYERQKVKKNNFHDLLIHLRICMRNRMKENS